MLMVNKDVYRLLT